jgi:hypothetical protein
LIKSAVSQELIMKFIASSLFVLVLPFAVAHAERPHHPPPQAAFDACAKAKAGDTCSVVLGDHTITGVCGVLPDSAALVCRPDHPHGPPPEAVDACSGRAAGDACSISHEGHAIAGTCARGPDGNGPLACRPSQPPPR